MRRSPQRHTLAILRTLIGLTQKEMAHLINRKRPTIQAIELGKLELSLNLAQQINIQTGVSTEWLLTNDITRPPIAQDGAPFTKPTFESIQANLRAPKTTMVSLFELWSTWGLFMRQVKMLATLYREAYKSENVQRVFYKYLVATKRIFDEEIRKGPNIEEQVKEQTVRCASTPVSLFELNATIAELEGATYQEFRRKIRWTNGQIPRYARPHIAEYKRELRRTQKKKLKAS
jgi:DNA-binding XRE family transcriptional regulator